MDTVILRGIHYRDRFSRFDQLYRIENPWHMDSEEEKFRFEETNRLIKNTSGTSVLCWRLDAGRATKRQGFQNSAIRSTASTFPVEPSERAKRRFPQAKFGAGDVFEAAILTSAPRFDLVVACEVLYYMRDVSAVLARIRPGNSCFVTYVSKQHAELASSLQRIPGRQVTD